MKTHKRILIPCLTFLAAFAIYEWLNGRAYTEYVYVQVPTPGMKMSDYESGCVAALVRAGTINHENRMAIQDLKSGR